MPPKNEEIDNVPLTLGTIASWTGAVVIVLTMVAGGVGAFDHLGNRQDLEDQRISTLISERETNHAVRDEQIKSLSVRCDALDRDVADTTRSLADVTARLAVIQTKEDDALATLQKIDAKVNGK